MVRAPLWSLLLVSSSLGGCEDPASVTQVVVVLDADETVAAASSRIGVEVVSQNGDRTQRTVEVDATPDHRWPFRVPIIPIGDDASRRVLLVAEAIDAEGASLGVQRVELSFVEDETRYVRLRFTESCRQTACGEGTTCQAGECVSACVIPAPSAEGVPRPGPCVREDAGVPADGGLDMGDDGGPVDAGGGDAGPVVVRCPTPPELAWVEGFEGTEVPNTCGEAPCETSPSGRVELVSHGSVVAPGEPAPCGSGMLRLVRFMSPSQAYFVAPLEPLPADQTLHLRAFLWVEAPDGAEVGILGLGVGDLVHDPTRQGIEVVAGDDRTLLVAHGEGETRFSAPSFPLGRWVCAELSLDPTEGTVRVGWDGMSLTATYPAASAFVGAVAHARVGVFRVPDWGTDGTTWVDEIAVGTEPLPCP